MKEDVLLKRQHNEFGRKILTIIAQIHPYVKHRLYTAETRGIIPHNMFNSTGIIDDAIVDLYEKYEGKIEDQQEIKLKLFSLISKKLSVLFKNEETHKKTLSTGQILEIELKQLEENFEITADNDLLREDELDDISYKQDLISNLHEDAEKNIIKSLEIEDSRLAINEDKRNAFNNIYNWLPLKTSNILDLFVFGKLTYEEIAKIKEVSPFEIKQIIQTVSNTFRKNLN